MKIKNSAFGPNLTREIKTQKLTREVVAQRSEISRPTIHAIEKGSDCTYSTMLKICEALKVPIGKMVSEQEEGNEIVIDADMREYLVDLDELPISNKKKVTRMVGSIIKIELAEVREELRNKKTIPKIKS